MSMAERLILGREDLCSSISKDLHDSVASDLAGLKMNADFFEMLCAKGKYDKLSELIILSKKHSIMSETILVRTRLMLSIIIIMRLLALSEKTMAEDST